MNQKLFIIWKNTSNENYQDFLLKIFIFFLFLYHKKWKKFDGSKFAFEYYLDIAHPKLFNSTLFKHKSSKKFKRKYMGLKPPLSSLFKLVSKKIRELPKNQ